MLEDNQIAVLTKDNVTLYDTDKNVVKKDVYHVTWDVEAAEKCGYEHFMQKEIAEQPKAIHDTLSPRIKDGRVSIPELTLTDEEIKNIGKIHIVACGSAWHVGMTAKYIFEDMARIPCETDLASEFRYRDPIIKKGDICIVISQSRETADTLAALREAKSKGAKVISIVSGREHNSERERRRYIYHGGTRNRRCNNKGFFGTACRSISACTSFFKGCGASSRGKRKRAHKRAYVSSVAD